jgi:hypothetical protein
MHPVQALTTRTRAGHLLASAASSPPSPWIRINGTASLMCHACGAPMKRDTVRPCADAASPRKHKVRGPGLASRGLPAVWHSAFPATPASGITDKKKLV